MSKRRANYAARSTVEIDAGQQSFTFPNHVAEQPAEYKIEPSWIDTAGRTRTWSLLDPAGEKLADITTKRGARTLVKLLSRTNPTSLNELSL